MHYTADFCMRHYAGFSQFGSHMYISYAWCCIIFIVVIILVVQISDRTDMWTSDSRYCRVQVSSC